MTDTGTGRATARRGAAEPDGGVAAPPRWFDLLALAGPIAIATVGTVGLLLAILGVYEGWLALALGVPATLVMLLGARQVLPRGTGSWRTAQGGAAIAAVVLAVGYLAFAGAYPSQNVIATRDPGLYMNTARWLSRDGDLSDQAKQPAFDGIEGLRFDSAGVYDMGGGEVEFQFNHLASVVMSTAYDVGGFRALFRMPALATAAGLLAVYGVTVRATRRPVVSLLAPGVLAVSMPMLFASRNTYSEPFAFALLWGAALALADLHRRPRLTSALIGGTALGALVSTRVDALLYVALVFPLAALSIVVGPLGAPLRARVRAWATALGAAGVVAMVGLVDLFEWSGDYATHLGPQLRLLWAALGASIVASAALLGVWRFVPASRRLLVRVRAPLSIGAGVAVVAVLLVGWLVRPAVQVVRGDYAYEAVRNIQRFEGMAVDATRTYAEDSLRWMAWYLGAPTLLAAIVGIGLLSVRSVRGRALPAAAGVLVLTLAAGGLYWWDPSITPDHLWATRRFVPAVLPGLAVMAAVAVASLWGVTRIDRRIRVGLIVVLAAALVVPPAVTTWPLRWQRAQYGYLNPVLEACDLLPDDAAVVVLGGYAGATLPYTLRSWCGVPVAAQGDAVDADTVRDVARRVAGNGFRLVLLSADSNDLSSFLDVAGGEPRRTNSAADHWLVQPTLDRAPDAYVAYERTLPVQLPFRLHVLEVAPG